MTSFINGLNLRPQEKRLVVVIGVVIFIVINAVWVWPYSKELNKVTAQMAEAKKNIADYQAKIDQDKEPKNGFQTQLRNMEKQQGGLLTNSSAIQLQTTIMTQSASAGVTVGNYSPVYTSGIGNGTNDFFEVQSININLESAEKELVDFLVNIGGDASMIRVRGMNLRPGDQNRYKLKGELTLNASYRKAPVKEAPLAASKPQTANARKPAMVPGGAKKTDKK